MYVILRKFEYRFNLFHIATMTVFILGCRYVSLSRLIRSKNAFEKLISKRQKILLCKYYATFVES